jgi:tetratricopeptide (TPR) repeat protein
MKIPDWRKLAFEKGVVPEPVPDGSRIVLWLRGGQEGGYQYWERIGTVARAEVTAGQGLCATPATSIRARQRTRGFFGKLFGGLGEGKADQVWTLPNGETAEQCGERKTDLVLVWPEDGAGALDETRVKSRWPQGKRFRRLGKGLFLVSGIEAAVATPGEEEPLPPMGCPRARGEQLLAEARKAGDRRAEATALTDLAIMSLSENDAPGAVRRLEEALAIVRQLGDKAREADVLSNLGQTALSAGQPGQARALFEQTLVLARETGDRFTEKLALERLGLAFSALGDHTRALALFGQALPLARAAGDRTHEANLLWHQGVQYAEMGGRDQAVAQARAAIDLLQSANKKPQAELFANHLRSYLHADPGAELGGNGAATFQGSAFGGSVVAGMAADPLAGAPAQGRASGPGLLRMAISAAKSMTTFLASGMKTVSPEVQQKRLKTCATCEHHTGLRCRICGCFTNVKTKMPHEDCPIGKWPA